MKAELIDTIPVGNTLGEGVTWDPRTGHVWWTDVQESRLYRLHFQSRKLDVFELPERLGSFGLTNSVDVLICAFATGFALYKPETGEIYHKTDVETEWSGSRMNDGRLDPQGRFWAGTMVEDSQHKPPEGGALYSITDSKVQTHFKGVSISNGLAWSNNGKRLYFSDSPRREIYIFDFDSDTGTLSNKSLFASTPDGAYPDGAMVDAEDHYWSAHWGAGQLVRYRPDGMVDGTVDVPATQSSCLAFGGPEMNIIFATSAREGLSDAALEKDPNAGHLFIYQTDIKGILQDTFYKPK